MRGSFNRRTATKVRNGKVQRKNNQRLSELKRLDLRREPPGHGNRHIVSKRDIQTFVELIPDWPRLSDRLSGITLIAPSSRADGMYQFYRREETGVIFLCAWPEDLWIWSTPEHRDAHQVIFNALGVSSEQHEELYLCHFSEAQARAFMLLHVFMHELGHHYDRITQEHWGVTKGEDYAEKFANDRFAQLLPAYVRIFGDPSREQS